MRQAAVRENKAGRGRFSLRAWFFAAFFSLCFTAFPAAAQQGRQVDDYSAGLAFLREEKFAEALPCFQRAAGEGRREAQYQLCLMYKKGQGMKAPDMAQAYAWCQKSAAQEFGPAEVEMADALKNGWAGTTDMAAALEYYKKASKQGVPEAQYALGLCYESGSCGVEKSLYQARTLYMWASGKGYGPATYRVAVLYEEGRGVRPSMSAAMLWYRKAAAMGNEDAIAKLESIRQQEEEMALAAREADRAAREAEKAAKEAKLQP